MSDNIEVEKKFRFGEVKLIKLNKTEQNWTHSRTLGTNMSLECVVPVVQGQRTTANGLNKLKQKVWYVR